MFLCLIYGGFSLIFFIYHAYNTLWQTEIAENSLPSSMMNGDSNRWNRMMDGNRFGGGGLNETRRQDFLRMRGDPVALLVSPPTLAYLIGGIISLLAGLTLWKIVHDNELKSMKQETTRNLLMPDEMAVIHALKKADDSSTQADLSKATGFNKVQIHRAVKRLEERGIIEKHEYGLTNKIVLKKDMMD